MPHPFCFALCTDPAGAGLRALLGLLGPGPAGRPVSASLRMRTAPRPGDVPPARGPRRLARAPGPAGPGRVSLSKRAVRATSAPDPGPLIAPMPRTSWSRLDASRYSAAVRRAHGPGWARCAACRRGYVTTTRGGRGGARPLPLSSRSWWSRRSEVRGGGHAPALSLFRCRSGLEAFKPIIYHPLWDKQVPSNEVPRWDLCVTAPRENRPARVFQRIQTFYCN